MTAVLVADSIGKTFGTRRILTSAFFSANASEIVALVGRNGAGKSTLLRICAGWLRPDHGFVELAGRRYPSPRPAAMARAGLFYLPADRSILSPALTLGHHLDAVEARFGRVGRADILDRLGIAHAVDQRTGSLSGGETRCAELAVAFLRRPICLLLDEPFQGITPADADDLMTLLRDLAGAGTAVVITGHETTFVFDTADRVVWVDNGSTIMLGPRAQALADWRFRRDYLGLAG